MVSKAVARAQAQVESRNFEIRKNVLKYDDVMNKQREVIYAQRSVVLEGTDEQVEQFAEGFVEDGITSLVTTYAPAGVYGEEWNLDELWPALHAMYPISIPLEDVKAKAEDLTSEQLVDMVLEDAFARYEEREQTLGAEVMRQVERRVMLSVVDRIWREHLYEMDHLRDGIGLRAVGQRDPLVEYQREAYDAFNGMMSRIKEEATGYFFNLPVEVAKPAEGDGKAAPAKGDSRAKAEISRPALRDDSPEQPAQKLSYTSSVNSQTTPTKPSSSYSVSGAGTSSSTGGPSPQQQAAQAAQAQTQGTVVKGEQVGRNDPCPCGSGLKHKKCHGA
jgi:preprotein translocase subunit SecA